MIKAKHTLPSIPHTAPEQKKNSDFEGKNIIKNPLHLQAISTCILVACVCGEK
jgi:hypothetical protein